jgi:hypothetical protein
MNYSQYTAFEKKRNDLPSDFEFKFKVISCNESIRRFAAGETKRKMVGNIYGISRRSSTSNGRIYLQFPHESFDPSFHYTDLELIDDPLNKLILPTEPQKLEYNYNEYSKIFEK